MRSRVVVRSFHRRFVWTQAEEASLRDAVSSVTKGNRLEPSEIRGFWERVAEHIPGRTARACRHRVLQGNNAQMFHLKMTEQQERRLHQCLEDVGDGVVQWAQVAELVGDGARPRQCERRARELFPELIANKMANEKRWSRAEDELLVEGNTKALKGRTQDACEKRLRHLELTGAKDLIWTSAQSDLLVQLVDAQGTTKNYSDVVKHFPGKSVAACQYRYAQLRHSVERNKRWTKEEVELLESLHQKHGSDWALIAESFPGRSGTQVNAKFRKLKEIGTRRRWTKADDEELRAAVKKHGSNNWDMVAEDLKRSRAQCRTRWHQSADPTIKKGVWTASEDDVLRECLAKGVTSWTDIAKLIPGRTRYQARNRALSVAFKGASSEWTFAQDEALQAAVLEHGQSWSRVAKSIDGKTEAQCRRRFTDTLSSQYTKGDWSALEDEKLRAVVAKLGPSDWRAVRTMMHGHGIKRSASSCRQRWMYSLDPSIKKGKWSVDEDTSLVVNVTSLLHEKT